MSKRSVFSVKRPVPYFTNVTYMLHVPVTVKDPLNEDRREHPHKCAQVHLVDSNTIVFKYSYLSQY